MRVSVVVVTYNHEAFVAQAVEGVLAQRTSFEFEILVSEDCSTDGTRGVLRRLQREHPGRIRLLLSERNQCDNEVLTRAIRAARGRYVALLDGDDYWTSPEKLQRQAEFLDDHPECGFCFHNVRLLFEEPREGPDVLLNGPQQKEFSTIEDLFYRNFVATGSVMFRRKLIRRFPGWFRGALFGDWPLHMLNARRGRIGYLPEVMGVYRIHGGGYWSGMSGAEQQVAQLDFLREMNRRLRYRYWRSINAALQKRALDLTKEFKNTGDSENARVYALESAWRSLFTPASPEQAEAFPMLHSLVPPEPDSLLERLHRSHTLKRLFRGG
jgi:glycosyltransferase involved in cell wall biosynthesis